MDVKVYSTEFCPYCEMAKEFLKEHDITFEDINVSKNQEMAREMTEKSGQRGVPVIEIDREIVIGFNKKKLKELLKIE